MGRLRQWLRVHVGTVRFRITALAAAVVAVVLILAGIVLVVAQRELVFDGVDEALGNRADDIEDLLHDDSTELSDLSCQASVSLATVALVIARAVNILR